jgi:translation elongation factor EF-4
MEVVVVRDRMEIPEIQADLVAVVLVVVVHQEVLAVLRLKYHLAVELDMEMLVVMVKLDLRIMEVVVEVLVLQEVLDLHNQEMVQVDMASKHHHHLEIL